MTELLRDLEKHDALRMAFARAPVPSRERDVARERIREMSQRADPEYWEGLMRRQESLEWCRITLRSLSNKLNERNRLTSVNPLKTA